MYTYKIGQQVYCVLYRAGRLDSVPELRKGKVEKVQFDGEYYTISEWGTVSAENVFLSESVARQRFRKCCNWCIDDHQNRIEICEQLIEKYGG